MKPTVSFKTIGCRLNQAETAAITSRFTQAGYTLIPFGNPCDVSIIHGCAITGKAEHSSLYAARQAKRIHPGTLVVLTGCPAQTLGEALRGNTSVDLIIGQTGKFVLPETLHQLQPARFPAPPPVSTAPTVPQFETQRALIKVQDGCDFNCAYCIVPTARGNPTSRPFAQIREEVVRVVEAGFNEIVLTGANLGRFGEGGRHLADLVRDIEGIAGLQRIRLSSIEITTTERAIIDHMADSSKLCHFLHIPLQSGDDRVLATMGRRYDTSTYRRVIDYAIGRIPDLGLGTDIIVGFPGEDEAAFDNTVSLVRDLPFSNLHLFPYSRRSGTRAESMAGQVPDRRKKERLQALSVIGETKRQLYAESFVGKPVQVLVERVVDGKGQGWTGQYMQTMLVGKDLRPRQIVTAIVTRAEAGTLEATVRSCDGR